MIQFIGPAIGLLALLLAILIAWRRRTIFQEKLELLVGYAHLLGEKLILTASSVRPLRRDRVMPSCIIYWTNQVPVHACAVFTCPLTIANVGKVGITNVILQANYAAAHLIDEQMLEGISGRLRISKVFTSMRSVITSGGLVRVRYSFASLNPGETITIHLPLRFHASRIETTVSGHTGRTESSTWEKLSDITGCRGTVKMSLYLSCAQRKPILRNVVVAWVTRERRDWSNLTSWTAFCEECVKVMWKGKQRPTPGMHWNPPVISPPLVVKSYFEIVQPALTRAGDSEDESEVYVESSQPEEGACFYILTPSIRRKYPTDARS